VEIAHAKLLLRSDRSPAVASIVSNEAEPQLSQSSGETAVTLDLVVNLRAQGAPHIVQQALQHSLDAWLERNGLKVFGISGQAFKPPRPYPTYRLRDAY
jgi:hypothetical protein